MTKAPLRVMVVDDTIFYRKCISDILRKIPEVELVGSASNGKIAVSRIPTLRPDLLTLDIEMPEMDGLEVLQWLGDKAPDVGAVVMSSLTAKGGDMAIRALGLGAFDVIQKAEGASMAESLELVETTLTPILRAFIRQREIGLLLKGKRPGVGKAPVKVPGRPAGKVERFKPKTFAQPFRKAEVVVIGISTGGPNALAAMLPRIRSSIGVPILVVQHMPPVFTQSLANSLDARCFLTVKEAQDTEPLKPDVVYIAPGGRQMKIVAGPDGTTRVIKITDDPPENSCRPSADYLFRSVASHYVGRACGVIMTGMGSDGTIGLKLMKRNGAYIIAQNEETCTVFGMPKAPIEAGIVDVISPLENIAGEIQKSVKGVFAR